MPKVFIKTYGCQMNERDSEQVTEMLVARGYEMTRDETAADVILLNTCSVRDMAEQKAIGKMGMLAHLREKKPELVFGFLGCMAQSRGAELLRDLPQVDLVVGTQRFHRVAEYVEEVRMSKLEWRSPNGAQRGMDDPRFTIVDVEEEADSQSTIRDHFLREKQATAFVSIMQGCNMHCTFCIVPFTRGAERSRTIEEIVDEVRGLVASGVKEVTLLGQIVNLYGRHEKGRDLPGCEIETSQAGSLRHSPFVRLLEAVNEVEGLERLRFTSPHPIGFRQDLIDAFARLPKLVEHVHLPLQSGSNRILKAMHRTYTAEKYRTLVEKLRAAQPGIALTTDVIVGFPGETDDDYRATRGLVEQIGFDNAFVFRYSKRRDTPAAALPDQISEEVKEDRNRDLLSVVDESARRKAGELVGQHVEILCEGPSKTNRARLTGRTRTNKIVNFDGNDRHVGQLFDVRITHSSGFSLSGDPVILD
jgi:tRNA-2-methylthio-N6-dimethylallyladenosine synthase